MDAEFARSLTAITESTSRSLAVLDGRPSPKRRSSLLLLALEREQVVDVVYSEARIARLVDGLQADAEVIDTVRRAILWIHRDEALHAQFIRGLLWRSGATTAKSSILVHQAVGAVGGWCSTVSRTGNDEFLGLRRLVGRLAMGLGATVGRVPAGLASAVRRSDFESFCRLNLTLEAAAVSAYEALLGVLEDVEASTFEQILADERRHADVFRVLIAAFDGNALASDWSMQRLTAALGAVSPWFVGSAHRNDGQQRTLGSNAPVHVAERSTSEDLVAALRSVMDPAGIASLVSAGSSVAVRPSFMIGYHHDDRSNIVSPEVLAAVARLCRDHGASDVAVIESPTVYDRFFANRSVSEVADYFGFDDPSYRIVDGSDDVRSVEFARGLAATSSSATWLDADVRIVVAKPCGDPAEVVHASLATMPGVGGRIVDQVYTDRLVDHRTASLMLLDVAPPDLAVLDMWGPVGDGPLGVMGCARPSQQGRLYVGRDAIAVDAAIVGDVGAPPYASEFIKRADQWFGTTREPVAAGSSAGPLADFRAPQASRWFRLISATAVPVYANLSGGGRLFVPAFDTDAFPSCDDPGIVVRSIRRAAQLLFGLHPPGRRR